MAEHVWKLDDRGEVDYIEGPYDSYCGGPYCTVCEEWFCQHERGFRWDAECEGPDARV